MLEDKNRIFQNLYGDKGIDVESSKERGDWTTTKEICSKGKDWIINEIKGSELINSIANQQDTLSLKDVELSVNNILECMSNALGRGDRIEIRGFGSFSLPYRPPRKAHNPKTGERVYT